MNQPLIFTERRRMPRLVDVALTLLAWGVFIWLIYNGLALALDRSHQTEIRPFFITLDTLTIYTVVALFNGLVLIGWAKYNQYRFRVERRRRKAGLEEPELATSLHISENLTHQLSEARVMTVYHDDKGDIDHIEGVGPAQDDALLPENVIRLDSLFAHDHHRVVM